MLRTSAFRFGFLISYLVSLLRRIDLGFDEPSLPIALTLSSVALSVLSRQLVGECARLPARAPFGSRLPCTRPLAPPSYHVRSSRALLQSGTLHYIYNLWTFVFAYTRLSQVRLSHV